MQFFTFFRLAIRYLYRYRRRYLFLFIAIAFGFSIVTFMMSIKDAMTENLYQSAQSHYAGDIIAIGYDEDSEQTYHLNQKEISAIRTAAQTIALNPEQIVLRTNMTGGGTLLYYNGTAVPIRHLIGVDWDAEADYFNQLRYQVPPGPLEGDTVIVLSAPVAHELGIKMGDRLILETETRTRQKNTGVFIVGGIVEDSSIFGYYKAYISRLALNTLMGYAPDDSSIVGFFIQGRKGIEQKRALLLHELEQQIPTAPLIFDRDDLRRETRRHWEGVRTFVLTLPVYLSEVSDLLGAINILTYFLYGMMLLLILVSDAVTYRLILHERNKEIGTMRTIGFYEADIRYILLMETFCLGLLSLAAGFILAWVFSKLLPLIPFSAFPSFDIFMEDGKMTTLYTLKTTLINIVSVFCMLFMAVFIPAFRASRYPLSRMLSGDEV
ncbi:ABC transporter permease [Breznakiellaceae bacterium SP9]